MYFAVPTLDRELMRTTSTRTGLYVFFSGCMVVVLPVVHSSIAPVFQTARETWSLFGVSQWLTNNHFVVFVERERDLPWDSLHSLCSWWINTIFLSSLISPSARVTDTYIMPGYRLNVFLRKNVDTDWNKNMHIDFKIPDVMSYNFDLFIWKLRLPLCLPFIFKHLISKCMLSFSLFNCHFNDQLWLFKWEYLL